MYDEIAQYIENTYQETLREYIYRAFGLVEVFQADPPFDDLIEELEKASYTQADTIAQNFLRIISLKLDEILGEHTIEMHEQTLLIEKIRILETLYRIPSLEDKSGIYRATMSTEPDDCILARVFDDIGDIEQVEFLNHLKSIGPNLIPSIRSLTEPEEAPPDTLEEVKIREKVIKNFKLFMKAVGDDHIGKGLIESGLILGAPLGTYINLFVTDIQSQSDTVFAKNFMALHFLSDQTDQNPLITFREYSEVILKDIQTSSSIESAIVGMVGRINEIRVSTNDQA